MKKLFAVIALITLFSIISVADIPQPKPTPKPRQTPLPLTIDSQMDIRIDSEASEPTLIISKGALSELRAQLENLDENSIDALASTSNVEEKPPVSSKIPTIMSGLFLSLALIFGGVWFARKRNLQATKTGKVALGLMLFVLFGASATVIFANMAPPFVRGFSANLFTSEAKRYSRITDKVKIQVVKGDNPSVTLVIPEVKGGKTSAMPKTKSDE